MNAKDLRNPRISPSVRKTWALGLAVFLSVPTSATASASALFQEGVDPAPSAVDTTRPPLRQLIEDAGDLFRTRKRLRRADLVDRSNLIANRVNHLIPKVEELQASWMDGGIMPPHPFLREAVNALYASVRALRIALPEEALPEMKKAARAIRRYRSGENPDSAGATPAGAPDSLEKPKPARRPKSKKSAPQPAGAPKPLAFSPASAPARA